MNVTSVIEVTTPVGLARVHLTRPEQSVGLLLLGHGAGGGIDAPDLQAAREAGVATSLTVGLVEQPWRVAGRRVAEPPSRLDAAWLAVVDSLRGDHPLVVGGRSSGARVACRTADETGARAVLALAFPLVTPRGVSRTAELRQPSCPRLVVQGARDQFGVPEPEPGVDVHVVAGADHGFGVRKRDGRTAAEVTAEVRAVVTQWLRQVLT